MKHYEFHWRRWRARLEAGRVDPAPVGNRYEVGFADWDSAVQASTGYDAADILDKAVVAARAVRDGHAAFERDTVLFTEREVDHPLMAWLSYACIRASSVRVLDFGGALGSLYGQHRALLDHLPGLRWGVVEQAHIAQAGRAEFETDALSFHDRPRDCVNAIAPNFLLLAGVLQYLPQPYALLDEMLELGLPYVLLHRTMAQRSGADRVAVQHVPPHIYPGSYPLWLLDARRLESVFDAKGYAVVDNFDPFPGSFFGPPDDQAPYQSWFLVRKGSAP